MAKVLFKLADHVLCPSNVVREAECETADGVRCKCKYLGAWDNEDGRYDEELEGICQKEFGMPFKSIRSLWVSRLNRMSQVWYFVKLIKT